jgi:hypothetical protein
MINPDKIQLIVKHLIDKMFEFANLDVKYDDLLGRKDDWYAQYTMTQEQYELWREYSIKYIKKEKKVPIKQAEVEFAWFNLSYGLKVEQPEPPETDNIN